MITSFKNGLCRALSVILFFGSGAVAKAQEHNSDTAWVGQRIIMLTGRGEVNFPDKNGVQKTKQMPNIVAPVSRVDGNKVWLLSPGEEEPGGWTNANNVILLKDAIVYFSSLLGKNRDDWDAFFRRAEAEHALNKRDDALSDYTTAIKLHPRDTYLYFRRARSYQARQMCSIAIADYDTVVRLDPNSVIAADAYSRQAKLYADCADSLQRDPQKAIEAARRAVDLDTTHPTYLTLLASAYASDGQFEKAIAAQKKALASPNFPPAYRKGSEEYLQELEQKLLRKK